MVESFPPSKPPLSGSPGSFCKHGGMVNSTRRVHRPLITVLRLRRGKTQERAELVQAEELEKSSDRSYRYGVNFLIVLSLPGCGKVSNAPFPNDKRDHVGEKKGGGRGVAVARREVMIPGRPGARSH